MSKLTPDQLVLRGIWIRAANEGELVLPTMTSQQATRTRFLLFREAKVMRAEALQGLVDSVVIEAMDMLTPRLQVVDELHKRVVIESKGSMDIAELGRAMGIETTTDMGQQKGVGESLARLNSLLNGQDMGAERPSSDVPDAPASNPFYSRQDRRD